MRDLQACSSTESLVYVLTCRRLVEHALLLEQRRVTACMHTHMTVYVSVLLGRVLVYLCTTLIHVCFMQCVYDVYLQCMYGCMYAQYGSIHVLCVSGVGLCGAAELVTAHILS